MYFLRARMASAAFCLFFWTNRVDNLTILTAPPVARPIATLIVLAMGDEFGMELTFDQFRSLMLAAGYDEVIQRIWPPATRLEDHTHPFEANGIVVSGVMSLSIQGEPARTLKPGDTYHVLAGVAHAETYGDEGATVWAARKN